MSKKRKQRRCRICRKRPVWKGGDVKNPEGTCKRCYHSHVWPERQSRRSQGVRGSDSPDHTFELVSEEEFGTLFDETWDEDQDAAR